jgi:hypothetical protein
LSVIFYYSIWSINEKKFLRNSVYIPTPPELDLSFLRRRRIDLEIIDLGIISSNSNSFNNSRRSSYNTFEWATFFIIFLNVDI